MTNNYFLFYLLILLFSSLAACGKSNSRSSGDTEQKECGYATIYLKEGELCQIYFGLNAGIYKCQLGEVINEKGQVMSANGTWLSLEDSTAVIIHCESE